MPRFDRIGVLLGCGLLGCASYQGTARDADLSAVGKDSDWRRIEQVPFVAQKGTKDCGAAALSGVLRYWEPALGKTGDSATIDAALQSQGHAGLSARELRDYARENGFSAYVFQGSFEDLEHELELGRPVIVGLAKPVSSKEALAHYEVFIGYNENDEQVLTLDPAHGPRQNDLDGFMQEWKLAGQVTLVVFPPTQAEATSRAE